MNAKWDAEKRKCELECKLELLELEKLLPNRGSQSEFSRVVFEVVLGTGFR